MSTEDQQFITRAVESAIRIGLVAALVVWTFDILAPFISIMVWAVIIAVAVYPAYRALAERLGNRHGLAGFLYVVIALTIMLRCGRGGHPDLSVLGEAHPAEPAEG